MHAVVARGHVTWRGGSGRLSPGGATHLLDDLVCGRVLGDGEDGRLGGRRRVDVDEEQPSLVLDARQGPAERLGSAEVTGSHRGHREPPARVKPGTSYSVTITLFRKIMPFWRKKNYMAWIVINILTWYLKNNWQVRKEKRVDWKNGDVFIANQHLSVFITDVIHIFISPDGR